MSKKKRFDRAAFHAKVGALDGDALRKILWNLYWRGPGALRERIEDALDPAEATRKRKTRDDLDGEVLSIDAPLPPRAAEVVRKQRLR